LKKEIEDKVSVCRLDKWLWVARFYRTKSLASEAVKKGNVKIEGKTTVKPSSRISHGNIVFIENDYAIRKIHISGLLETRVCFELAKDLYDILEEKETKVKEYFNRITLKRKPNKKERRELLSLKNLSIFK
jgi:ribosome-associated heat shock protein Hsp15